jgi:hypothetical protein
LLAELTVSEAEGGSRGRLEEGVVVIVLTFTVIFSGLVYLSYSAVIIFSTLAQAFVEKLFNI